MCGFWISWCCQSLPTNVAFITHIVALLSRFTGKPTFCWKDGMVKAFKHMRALVAQDCLLVYQTYNEPFHLYKDASSYQIRVYLKATKLLHTGDNNLMMLNLNMLLVTINSSLLPRSSLNFAQCCLVQNYRFTLTTLTLPPSMECQIELSIGSTKLNNQTYKFIFLTSIDSASLFILRESKCPSQRFCLKGMNLMMTQCLLSASSIFHHYKVKKYILQNRNGFLTIISKQIKFLNANKTP